MSDKKFDDTNNRACSVAGCDRPYSCKGLCSMHYKRKWRTGTTRESDSLRGKRYVSAEDRFNQSYLVDAETGCWNWQNFVTPGRYGTITVNGKAMRAHRYSWSRLNGDIPQGMVICHKCDNPSCVNPDHLFIGTRQDNEKDKVSKGRQAKGRRLAEAQGNHVRCGEQCPTSKLTDSVVTSIRNDPRSQRVIADEYGTTQSNVYRIKNRHTWRHL